MAQDLSWGEVEIPDEAISERDITDAESSGRLPAVKFIGECVESNPREAKLSNYTCYAANLKWRVDELIECPPGTPATDEQKDAYEGRFIWDDVLLPHPDEKDGIRKRRILVAKRCGLINNTSDAIPARLWADEIVGKRAIISTEEQEYEDKNGKPKKTVKVAFDGYESIDSAVSKDEFEDI